MNPKYPKRLQMAHLPTPVEKMARLSQHLGGPELYIKRDDLTGLATGGNKTRKLEFLVAEALAHQCDYLVTVGGPQSNHCRQTAAAAARYGLGCALVLSGDPPAARQGNLLLDELLGAEIHWAAELPRAERMVQVVSQLMEKGHKPYPIPLGGSNVIGATGYVLAMQELAGQLSQLDLQPDFIIFASSSGGTQAGIVLGAQLFDCRGQVLGISIDHPADELQTQVAALATATATHLDVASVTVADRVKVNDDYLGEGYAIVSDLERDAIRLLARLEGILLDPVYTGRAMGGLIDLIQWGALTKNQKVLFWHTGGNAALSAFSEQLT